MKKPNIQFIGGKTEEGGESYFLRLIMPNNDKFLDEQLIRENIHMTRTFLQNIIRKHAGRLNENFTIIFDSKEDAENCSIELNEFIKKRF